MSERNDADFLADILEAAKRVLSYTTNLDYDPALKTISGEALDD